MINSIIGFFFKSLRLLLYMAKGKYAYAFSQFEFTTYLRRILLHFYFSSNKKLNENVVLFDISYVIDRYAFNLLNTYKLADYDIYLKPNYKFYVNSKGLYFDEIFSFLNVRFYYNEKQLDKYFIKHYVYDSIEGKQKKSNFDKRVFIEDNQAIKSQELRFPFGFHPYIYYSLKIRSASDLSRILKKNAIASEKVYRIFFAGAIKANDYYKIKNGFPSLIDRNTLFDYVIENFSEDLAQRPLSDVSKSILILNSKKNRLDSKELFEFLGKSSFLIAPPGFEMPFCHNVIEAMAFGVVPIIQYGAMWYPNLVHEENCLRFNTLSEFDECIRKALKMNDEKLAKMQLNVTKYFNQYLLPQSFVNLINTTKDREFMIKYISGYKNESANCDIKS